MVDPDAPSAPEPEPARAGASIREAIAIGAALLVAVAGGLWWASSPSPTVAYRATSKGGIDPDYARYVGDSSCRECHPGESAAHSRSGHARTLRKVAESPIARGLDGQSAEDPEQPGVTWSFAYRDGKLVAGRSEGGKSERSLVEYAFGSGHHATTFLSLVARDPSHPTALEHRMSWYAHSKALGLTPGQSLAGHASGNSPRGRLHSSGDTLKCFDCHATATSDRGSAALDESKMIANVGCERCHGPGKLHVEAARSNASPELLKMPFGPDRWTAREQMDACGACHRLPDMVQPGSIRVDNPVLVRHQPVGLMQSACYQKSKGDLSCVTCHDPHARTSTDREAYEAACLACHQSAEQKRCSVSAESNCLECHMPKREVARGMTMTDHWIRRKPRLDRRPRAAAVDPSG